MIITVAQYKGGVGKTTTAIHFAAYFQALAPTLLIDSDPNRNAVGWARRGDGKLPFKVVPETQGPRYAPQYTHIVIDTKARPTREDTQEIADACDLLVLPVTPDAMALETLMEVIDTLKSLGTDPTRYRVLITMVPPKPARDGELLYERLSEDQVPLFTHSIRTLKAFKKAALAGVPVYAISDPRAGEGWQDYQQVCQEVVP